MTRAWVAAIASVGAACAKPPGHAATIDCPAAMPAAHAACGGLASCQYPEGTCACHADSACPGASAAATGFAWSCQAARTDGCPDAIHVDDPCTLDHECSYDDCGHTTYRCAAGQWRLAP